MKGKTHEIPKTEIRNPKEGRIPKSEGRRADGCLLGLRGLGFRPSFSLRKCQKAPQAPSSPTQARVCEVYPECSPWPVYWRCTQGVLTLYSRCTRACTP